MSASRSPRGVASAAAVAILVTLVAQAGCAPAGREVVVYTSVDQVYAEPILDQFQRDTGIRVRAVYDAEAAKTTGLANRLIAEKERPRADVWWSGEIVQTLKLADRGVLAEYRPAGAGGIPGHLRDPDGLWTGIGGRARILLVGGGSETPAPASILDLEVRDAAVTADGAVNGDAVGAAGSRRIAMSNPVFGTAATQAAVLYAAWGPEEAVAHYQTVADAGVSILQGNGDVRDQVVSGALDWGLTDTDDALAAIEQGADVRIIVPDQEEGGFGAILIPNTVALVVGGPDPEAGKLLVDYLVSAETERRLVEHGWIQFPVRGRPDPRVASGEVRFAKVDWSEAYEQLEASAEDMREIFLK